MFNIISTQQLPFNNTTNHQEYYNSSPSQTKSYMTKYQTTQSKPTWSKSRQDSDTSPSNQTSTTLIENSDDHYNRHLENIVTALNLDEEEQLDDDEINEPKSDKKTNDEDDDLIRDDEPKVFQVEDVDLPSLITASPQNTTNSLFNSNNKTVIKLSLNKPKNDLIQVMCILNVQTISIMHCCFQCIIYKNIKKINYFFIILDKKSH